MSDLPLTHLPVLLLDCQTTAGSPRNGSLLEIGWSATRAVACASPERLEVQTRLVQQPHGTLLCARVTRLTGIAEADLAHAVPPESVWRRLTETARAVADEAGEARCPAVIHFARFESAFLADLHRHHGGDDPFPFSWLCTHEMARRLYPQLPRKGLRALAGHLGHGLDSLKRCRDHLRATAMIWHHTVQRLAERHQVHTMAQLTRWLRDTAVAPAGPRTFPMPREQRGDLPDRPGIYRFLRTNGDLLYIGKARSLKTRLASYFQPGRRHAERTLEMLTQAARVTVETTPSALEAALGESEAIKRLQPPYNMALTAGRRRPGFCARDFGAWSERPDERTPLGPLPLAETAGLMHAVGRLTAAALACTAAEQACPEQLFLLAERWQAAPGVMAEGAARFVVHHADLLQGRCSVWHALRIIGRRAWLTRRSDAEAADEAAEAEPTSDPEITAEQVARRMTALTAHCGHQLRRARWLTRLSEATMAWPRGEAEWRWLRLARGRVTDCGHAGRPGCLPPPETTRAWRARQACIDLAAYDRLRVLTTEVRRLLAEGRPVRIVLSRRVVLDETRLERLLRWI